MIIERFYDEKLAQASYLVGCAATGEALVVDPNRDAEAYMAAAERLGLRITHVAETHIHADFVSGTRELTARAGARPYLSAAGGEAWHYRFAERDAAVLLHDGDRFHVGNVLVDVKHTPGHTPEHLAFVVTDTAGTDAPMGVFTGDFVFVGDVGRPDLLEKAAGLEGTTEDAARALFHSLQAFKGLPDYLQVWPGHGAGSACGKALSAVPQSTIGYEKRFNWAFQCRAEHELIAAVLDGQPEPPAYFANMKRINRAGPILMGGMPRPQRVTDAGLGDALTGGALVIDTRPAQDFAKAYVPGTLSIPLNRSFTKWAGSLLPYERDLYLIVSQPGSDDRAAEAARDLALIGLDRVKGYFADSALETWATDGRTLGTAHEIAADELHARRRGQDVAVLDVRDPAEWAAAHIPDVAHIPLGDLPRRLADVPRGQPLIVYCRAGPRSAIAASLLRAHGFRDVLNLRGGIVAWQAAGKVVEP